MAQQIAVSGRIFQKHKGITEEDVLCAWGNRVKCQMRIGPWPPQYVAVGFDSKGRSLQMVALYDSMADSVLIFHAMSLTGKVKKELGLD